MVWFTVLGVLVVIVYYVVLTRRTQRMSDATPSPPSPQVQALSIEQARVMVDDLIAKGDKLFVEPAIGAAILSEQFGPATREFFSRYATLRTRLGGFRLAAADVRPSEYVPGYLSIGHSEDWDVVQKSSNNQVFVVEGAETRDLEMEVRFPSVYHLVLDEAQRT